MPVLRLAAVFLLLPIGQAHAVGWESDLVLGEDPQGVGASVMDLEAAGSGADSLQFQDAPVEAVPLETPPPAPALADPGVPAGMPMEAGAAWQGAGGSFVPAGGAACGPYPCHAGHGHACWSLRADTLVLWRNAPASRPLFSTAVPDTGGIGPTALDAKDLSSDVLAAPRVSLLRTDCDGRTLEATYLYAGNFYSERSLPFVQNGYYVAKPGLYGMKWGPDGTTLNDASATLLGQLQSLEFNESHCIWADTCRFLIGARWLQWNETLTIQDSYTYPGPPESDGTDFYETRCFNSLWGGQIGLDTLLLGRPGCSRIEGLVKAGAYYNNPGQASTYRSSEGDDDFSRSGGPACASFVGEVGLTAVMPITCNCDFRIGYFGLWLTNLAQPSEQLSQRTNDRNDWPAAGLDTEGYVMLQGLSLGVEHRW